MYPAYLEENIHLVEDKRVRRLIEAIPRLGEDEKTALLRRYHPDNDATKMRQLRVGVNKGNVTPVELADLLEGNSRIDPGKIDPSSPDYNVDILVIGCGGAGASAALLAQEGGARVLVATKLRLGDANTVGAQAGTQAADRPGDASAQLCRATMS